MLRLMIEGDIGGYSHRGGTEVRGGDISGAAVCSGAAVWMSPRLCSPAKASKGKMHIICPFGLTEMKEFQSNGVSRKIGSTVRVFRQTN